MAISTMTSKSTTSGSQWEMASVTTPTAKPWVETRVETGVEAGARSPTASTSKAAAIADPT
jgi:hypothetical protein